VLVVPTAARQREGLPELLQAMQEVATGQVQLRPNRSQGEPPALKAALRQLVSRLEAAYPDLPNARWVALRLLDGDERIIQALKQGELGGLTRQAVLA